jgi:hypothetical protein
VTWGTQKTVPGLTQAYLDGCNVLHVAWGGACLLLHALPAGKRAGAGTGAASCLPDWLLVTGPQNTRVSLTGRIHVQVSESCVTILLQHSADRRTRCPATRAASNREAPDQGVQKVMEKTSQNSEPSPLSCSKTPQTNVSFCDFCGVAFAQPEGRRSGSGC